MSLCVHAGVLKKIHRGLIFGPICHDMEDTLWDQNGCNVSHRQNSSVQMGVMFRL